MRHKFVLIASVSWMAAIVLCVLASPKIFGPMAVGLFGVVIVTEKKERVDDYSLIVPTIITAAAIFFGVQKHQEELEKAAYWAHRDVAGCRDADRWAALGGGEKYPFRKPTSSEVRRCEDLDDATSYQRALRRNGW